MVIPMKNDEFPMLEITSVVSAGSVGRAQIVKNAKEEKL
jgi:hypothetical protein